MQINVICNNKTNSSSESQHARCTHEHSVRNDDSATLYTIYTRLRVICSDRQFGYKLTVHSIHCVPNDRVIWKKVDVFWDTVCNHGCSQKLGGSR